MSRLRESQALRKIAVSAQFEASDMLSIQNLTHVYPGGVRALDCISLEIPAGMFGLLGPNGAGDSTLMRSIATL